MKRAEYIVLNGEYFDSNEPFLGVNRAFNFGDSLFESIRIINGLPYNLKSHIERILEGSKVIGLEVPSEFTVDFFFNEIKNLLIKNGIEEGAKARLTFFRAGEGTYFPTKNKVSFLLTVEALSNNFFKLNSEGLSLSIYQEIKRDKNVLSKYKTGNSLLFVMAANYAMSLNLDDCFLLNQNGKIIESIASNIFIVSNGVLYTPPLEDGCIAGTMRMNVVNTALEQGFTVYESSLSPQNLLAADEIFLTNAIKGIQWVGSYQNKRYFNNTSKKLIELINVKETSLKMDLQES